MALPRDMNDLPTDLLDHVDNMMLFGREFELRIDRERIPLKEFSFAFKTPRKFDADEMLSTYTVTNQVIEADVEMTPEQGAEISQWWTEFVEREWRRQMGLTESEYTQSLRAAGVQV